jgi:ABC-type Mn2+/Zn2+ transport system ATPase subunit
MSAVQNTPPIALTNIALKRGTVLVLAGPQGCGKTTIAADIALRHGTFKQIEAHQLDHRTLFALLADAPQTLVVEGLPQHRNDMATLKALITSTSVEARRADGTTKRVTPPHFIFCVHDTAPLPWQGRRFHVIKLGKTGAAT